MTGRAAHLRVIFIWVVTAIANGAWGAPAESAAQPQSAASSIATPQAFDRLPHEEHPKDLPYPDYFNEALKLTAFRAGDRFKALKLAPRVVPEVLILPVQTQAFGLTPAIAALVAARMDEELVARGIKINRQTELFDADGPYVRRFEEAQISAFAAAHAKGRVLALYLGRDAAGTALITISSARGKQLTSTTRLVAEAAAPEQFVNTMAASLAAALDELGFAPRAPASQSTNAPNCSLAAWELHDVDQGARVGTRACHALIMGTLLPEFVDRTQYAPRPKTADKLAWLAQAYVEADSLAPATAAMVRTLAWSQLDLTDSQASVASAVEAEDPVVRPLARLLWARQRNKASPVQSPERAAEEYAAAAAKELPEFARAVFLERANFFLPFRRVNLCAIEVPLATVRLPKECLGAVQSTGTSQPHGSRAERALLDEWRLAASFREIEVEGIMRGDPKARAEVIAALPARIADHPFIRQIIFISEHFDSATGAYDPLAKRATQAAVAFVQATADLQRWESFLPGHLIRDGQWTRNEALRQEPAILKIGMEEQRLAAVLEFDAFRMRGIPSANLSRGRLSFLTAGPLVALTRSGTPVRQPPLAAPVQLATADAVARQLNWRTAAGTGQDVATLERELEAEPKNIEARVQLGLARMRAGQSVAQFRSLMDARSDDARTGSYAISESHTWAFPAHAMFFAGELDAARYYYDKVARIGTSSSSDLHARVRLRLIARDIPGALNRAIERLDRYENDFGRRDVAGFEFMLGHKEAGWAALAPRLAQSSELELWMGAQAGHRLEAKPARQVQAWIKNSGYGHAQINGLDIGTMYLGRYVTDDRVPTDEDARLIKEAGQNAVLPAQAVVEALVKLKQLASAPSVSDESLQPVRELMLKGARNPQISVLQPLYTWATWRSSGGSDPMLTALRSETLSAGFDTLLAKGMLLGLEKKPAESLQFLRAARVELAQLGVGSLDDAYRSAAYSATFTNYMLFRETRDPVYRDEALRLARAYEVIFPFQAWTYAADALLSSDGEERSMAACRAAYLDRNSEFLRLSNLKPNPAGPECRKALW
jgi:hypothetical protein